MGGFFGAGIAAWVGYTKKKIGAKVGGEEKTDAVVISAAFADSRVIERLADAIERLNRNVEHLEESVALNAQVNGSTTNAINYCTESIRTITLELIRNK